MINIIGLAVLVNMFTHWFRPIQWVKEKVGWYRLPEMLSFLNCTKCLGFWTGLAVTQSLFQAATISLLAYCIDNLIYYIDNGKE
jgi:hypothetical protein